MDPATPTELANTVTGVCTFLAGVVPLTLSRFLGPHPRHWLLVWWTVVVTGVFTVWYHGFGESPALRALDTGSNLVVAVAVLYAILQDYYSTELRNTVLRITVPANVVGIALLFLSDTAITPDKTLPLGEWGGYHLGEVVLVVDALLVTTLWVRQRHRLPAAARGLLLWGVGFFLLGAALSTADSHRIVLRIVPLHALWHVVGAFGFVLLWGATQASLGKTE